MPTNASKLGNIIKPMTDLGTGCGYDQYMFLLIIILILYIAYTHYNKK
jgi:hypothetical protein